LADLPALLRKKAIPLLTTGTAFLRLKADAPVLQQHRDKPCCICRLGAFSFAAAPTPGLLTLLSLKLKLRKRVVNGCNWLLIAK
jgi:hypothetical protein